MDKQMNQAKAIKILIKAAHISQKKGVFNLEEAVTIHKAISVFMAKNESHNELFEENTNTVNNTCLVNET